MPGDAVQNEDVAWCESRAVKKKGKYLSGKKEMLVLKKKAPLKDAVDKVQFSGRKMHCRSGGSGKGAKFRAEIEVMGPFSQETAGSDHITKRTLSGACGTQEQDSVHGKRRAGY